MRRIRFVHSKLDQCHDHARQTETGSPISKAAAPRGANTEPYTHSATKPKQPKARATKTRGSVPTTASAQVVNLPTSTHLKSNINVMKTHNLFISHSWAYSKHYDNLVRLLEDRPYFDFKNYSVPPDDPVHDAENDKELLAAIKAQMKPCGVVIIMAGVYSTYSKWIKKEISLAQDGFEESKPILAIKPHGNVYVSTVVSDAADKIVNWNTESIVAAIRELSK